MRRVNHKSLRAVVTESVQEGSTINTDELKGYRRLRDKYKHQTVNHSEKVYVRKLHAGKCVTTNTVESSFSLLKRGIVGAFHHISKKHLHRYAGEFDYRWNERKASDVDRTAKALKNSKRQKAQLQTVG